MRWLQGPGGRRRPPSDHDGDPEIVELPDEDRLRVGGPPADEAIVEIGYERGSDPSSLSGVWDALRHA